MSRPTPLTNRLLLALAAVSILALSALATSSVRAEMHVPPEASSPYTIELSTLPPGTDIADRMGVSVEPGTSTRPAADALHGLDWTSGARIDIAAPKRRSTIWLKARLYNDGDEAISRWLELVPWRVNSVDVYYFNDADELVNQRRYGTGRAGKEDTAVFPVIPVNLASQGSTRLLARITSDSTPLVKMLAWDPLTYASYENSTRLEHAIIASALITLCLILLTQLNVRYTLLSVWLFSTLLLQVAKEGYLSQLLIPSLSAYTEDIRATAWSVSETMFVLCSIYLLGLERHRLWRNARWLVPAACLVMLLITLSLDGNLMRYAGMLISLLSLSSWPFIAASAQGPGKKRLVIAVLLTYWIVSVFIILGYLFNFYYTTEFDSTRIVIQGLLISSLLLAYSVQERQDEKQALISKQVRERRERQALEKTVADRTAELRQALTLAEKANRDKSTFLSHVTHDLRSPLTTILGYSQPLQGEPGRLGKIHRLLHGSASHMLSLLNNLSDYTRGTTSSAPRLQSLYLPSFLGGAAQTARPLAERHGNVFEVSVSAGLPAVASCDPVKLRQVILNLIDNAGKYTQEGRITLSAGAHWEEDDASGATTLQLIVEDTGCGIAPDKIRRLHEPFFRVSDSTDGSGLGLTIVNDLVQALGGQIDIQSAQGVGTTVRCDIPIEPLPESAVDHAYIEPSHPELIDYDARGMSVWVVEDIAAIRGLLQQELSDMGFDVQLADDGARFVREAGSDARRPDLVITDYYMPGANGDDVRRVAHAAWPEVPVILLSAAHEDHHVEGPPGDQGFFALLAKPVDIALLRNTVAAACGLREPAAPTDESLPQDAASLQPPPPELTASLKALIDLGALSDIVEWSRRLGEAYPLYKAFAQHMEEQASFGDMEAVRRLYDASIGSAIE